MHRPEVEHVIAHLRGEESLPAYAARHQLDVEQLRLWKALYLSGGESAFARKPSSRRRAYAAGALVLAAALLPVTALAVGTCAQDTALWPLSTFCADQPATASEMNDNLRKLVTTITGRTGAMDGGVDIRQPNTAQLIPSDGNLRIKSGQPFANVLLNTSGNVGGTALTTDSTDTLFLNWGATFAGGTQVQSPLNVAGDLTISGGGDGRGLQLSTGVASGTALAAYQGDRLVLNYANSFAWGTQVNGSMQIDGDLTISGHLRANGNTYCTESWGGYNGENAFSYVGCNDGFYLKALECRHTTTGGVQCHGICCQ